METQKEQTIKKDKIAIFKTKSEVLSAMGRGDVAISKEVLINPEFRNADNNEILGFMAESGSDYTLIDVKSVKDNPEAFFNLAFGGGEKSGSESKK